VPEVGEGGRVTTVTQWRSVWGAFGSRCAGGAAAAAAAAAAPSAAAQGGGGGGDGEEASSSQATVPEEQEGEEGGSAWPACALCCLDLSVFFAIAPSSRFKEF
jgi:hypothetical protein